MKILFLHTLASNITLFKPLAATSLPKHDIFHDVQESFLSNIRKTGATPSIVKQIQDYLSQRLTQGYDFIVCTCSTLGPIVDAYPDNRVFRVDRPMAEQTIGYSRILVAVTLESYDRTHSIFTRKLQQPFSIRVFIYSCGVGTLCRGLNAGFQFKHCKHYH